MPVGKYVLYMNLQTERCNSKIMISILGKFRRIHPTLCRMRSYHFKWKLEKRFGRSKLVLLSQDAVFHSLLEIASARVLLKELSDTFYM